MQGSIQGLVAGACDPRFERVRAAFRSVVKAWDRDRELHPDLERSRAFLESDAMARAIRPLA